MPELNTQYIADMPGNALNQFLNMQKMVGTQRLMPGAMSGDATSLNQLMAINPDAGMQVAQMHTRNAMVQAQMEMQRRREDIAQQRADAYSQRMLDLQEKQGRQYGAPIYSRDENGKIHAWQTSSMGDAKEVTLPPGHTLVDKSSLSSGEIQQTQPKPIPRQSTESAPQGPVYDGGENDPDQYVLPKGYKPLADQGAELAARKMGEGELKVPSGSQAKDAYWKSVYQQALRYNPNLTEQDYNTRQKADQYFTSGQGSLKLKATNAVLNHAEVVDKLLDELHNNGLQSANKLANYFAQQTGDPRISSFQAAMSIYGPELVTSMVPAGGGEAEREEAKKALIDMSGGYDAQKAALATIKQLQAGQLIAVKQQMDSAYNSTPRNPKGGRDFSKFLSPAAQRILAEHEASSDQGKAGGHDEAIQWAQSHPDDPRAAKILKMHGM